MNYYEAELRALKKSNRFRKRVLANYSVRDFASNDYLGLSKNKEMHTLTCKELASYPLHSPTSSMLINGYHQIHKDFEKLLCTLNRFEDAIVTGSGFVANIALIESLVRKNDTLFIDEKFHASGMLIAGLEHLHVEIFHHNDADELNRLLYASKAKRKIVAVEGVYSMEGDLLNKEIFNICDNHDAILIVDEAHSSGVVGENLLGVFELFDIRIKPNYIKMGTLGKAYGSFGAYILASSHIIEYLTNRAKPIIYATALSLYDTLLAYNNLEYIIKNKQSITKELNIRRKIAKELLGIESKSMIICIFVGNNQKVMQIQSQLRGMGFAIGAIRQPTVSKAILRIIPNLSQSADDFRELCRYIMLRHL